jgi:hypothetical protein
MDCNDTNWPLAIAVAEGPVTSSGLRQFLTQWGLWLDRASPFVLLRIFTCDEAVASFDAMQVELQAWAQANNERIRKLVLGIATTVPERCLEHSTEAEHMFGIPVRTFTSSLTAVSWLQNSILAPAGLSVDSL